MSRTLAHKPKQWPKKGKNGLPNYLGICHCQHCKIGRMGKKSWWVIKLKRKFKRWWTNKPAQRGAYTD